MKSIASFFPKRERKPTPGRMVTPTQVLGASVAVFLVSLWPLLSLQLGRPTSTLGEFLFFVCATVSTFGPAAFRLVTFMDMVRSRADARLIAAFVLSLAGVAAIAAFIYLRLHQYGLTA